MLYCLTGGADSNLAKPRRICTRREAHEKTAAPCPKLQASQMKGGRSSIVRHMNRSPQRSSPVPTLRVSGFVCKVSKSHMETLVCVEASDDFDCTMREGSCD